MAGYTSMIQTIGNTPLLELRRYQEQHKLKASIFAKLEGFNPAGSVKDRVALAMIEDAKENFGRIPSSSNRLREIPESDLPRLRAQRATVSCLPCPTR